MQPSQATLEESVGKLISVEKQDFLSLEDNKSSEGYKYIEALKVFNSNFKFEVQINQSLEELQNVFSCQDLNEVVQQMFGSRIQEY